jgi:hypothetical protein
MYKATVSLKGCGIFRNHGFDDIKAFCSGKTTSLSYYDHGNSTKTNSELVLNIVDFLESNPSIAYGKRIQGNFIDFYTNDEKFYRDFLETFEPLIRHGVEPLPGHVDQILNSSDVFVTKLPHGKYKFKVFLLPHRMKSNKDQKQQFIDWVTSQSPRILMSKAVKSWFIRTEWNWDRRYVLVEDEQTLFMMKLRSAEVVGKAHEYQLVDK